MDSYLEGEIFYKYEQTNNSIKFYSYSGFTYRFYHDQDCCESVTIEDIIGDLDDLIDSKILLFEEVVSNDSVYNKNFDYSPESFTWTFYKFATIKGYVTIRWFGESNGYYSESVDMYREYNSDVKKEGRSYKLSKFLNNI